MSNSSLLFVITLCVLVFIATQTIVVAAQDSGVDSYTRTLVSQETTGAGDMAQSSNGELYFTTFLPDQLKKISNDGQITNVGDSLLDRPYGVKFDGAGNMFIANSGSDSILKIATNGQRTTLNIGGLSNPYGIAFTQTGEMIFVDAGNNQIKKLGLDGNVTVIAGNGQAGFSGDGEDAKNAKLYFPFYVVVNKAGEVIFTDSSNHVVRKIGLDGKISTIAGIGGQKGYNGDGIPATQATLDDPIGIALTSTEEILISEYSNFRIRKISHNGNISTIEHIPNTEFGFVFEAADGRIYFSTWGNIVAVYVLTANCKTGYFGNRCIPMCFGVMGNETSVCSNNKGKCISPDNCNCNQGWAGNVCATPVCFNKLSTDSTVCNGNGLCISPDVCQCTGGFSGAQCNDSQRSNSILPVQSSRSLQSSASWNGNGRMFMVTMIVVIIYTLLVWTN